jgi:molecular chaperone HscB
MALRESLEDAKDASALDALRRNLVKDKQLLEKAIAEAIDAKRDYAGAAGLVRKLQFLDKLDSEIDAAYETIE